MSDEVKTKITPHERKKRTAELREKHQPLFDALGVPDAVFIPKMAHFVTDLDGLHMGFFESELNHGEDVYTEKVSKHIESEDPDRTLYKIPYNPYFRDEYETSEPTSSGSVRYFIPVDEMEIVKAAGEPKTKKEEFSFATKSDDDITGYDNNPILANATLKDFAAIMLKVPNSEHEWLNEMIKKAK